MTHYAMEGLRGDPEALDDAFLTVDSLFGFVSSKVQRRAQSFQNEQQPVLHQTATGTIILDDFSAGILNPDTFDPGSHPIVKIELLAYTRAQVIEVLTEIKNWTYSQGHIESKVNDKLGEYFKEDLGRRASSLRRSLGFAAGDVAVEDDATITFPDGYFDIRYESENKKTGTFVSTISLESSWFQRLGDIEDITTALDVNPKEMRFSLSAKTSPMDAIPGLEARGWNVTSQLPRKVEAEWKGHIFIVEPTQITIRGFTLSELFGTSGDSEKAGSVTSAISAVTGRIVSAKLPPPEPSKSDEDEE